MTIKTIVKKWQIKFLVNIKGKDFYCTFHVKEKSINVWLRVLNNKNCFHEVFVLYKKNNTRII